MKHEREYDLFDPDGQLNMGYDETFDQGYNSEFDRDFDQYKVSQEYTKKENTSDFIQGAGLSTGYLRDYRQSDEGTDNMNNRKYPDMIPLDRQGAGKRERNDATQQYVQSGVRPVRRQTQSRSEGAYREPVRRQTQVQNEEHYREQARTQIKRMREEMYRKGTGTQTQSRREDPYEEPIRRQTQSRLEGAYREPVRRQTQEQREEQYREQARTQIKRMREEMYRKGTGTQTQSRREDPYEEPVRRQTQSRREGVHREPVRRQTQSRREEVHREPVRRQTQSRREEAHREPVRQEGSADLYRKRGNSGRVSVEYPNVGRRSPIEGQADALRLRRMREKKRRRQRAIAIRFMMLIISVIFVGVLLIALIPSDRYVKAAVTMEAGQPCPTVEDFLKKEVEDAEILSGIEPGTKLDHVQEYNLVIKVKRKEYQSILYVRDTKAPVVTAKDKTITKEGTVVPEDFIESIDDDTDCKAEFKKEPKPQGNGSYPVEIRVTDEGGNTTDIAAQLIVCVDNTPPVIEGVEEITIKVGEGVSYKKNVTVTDDQDESVKLEIDNSAVNTDAAGDYPITYIATDAAGNRSEVSTVLHVIEPIKVKGSNYTEDDVNAEADKVLAQITNSSMSQYEIIKAIYNWCHTKIAFVDTASKDNWVEGAYAGLVKRKGDCYTYAMTAKCLLTRAGIKNMDIERIRYGNGMHFWNLVDIGEGWHHFDTCRRVDGSTFFYLTDAELMAYSDKHKHKPDYPNGSHYYDRSLYPEIP